MDDNKVIADIVDNDEVVDEDALTDYLVDKPARRRKLLHWGRISILCLLFVVLIMTLAGSFTHTTTIDYDQLIREDAKTYITRTDATSKPVVIESFRWPWNSASDYYVLIRDFSDENVTIVTNIHGDLWLTTRNNVTIVLATYLILNSITLDCSGIIDLHGPTDIGPDLTLNSPASIY